MQNCLQAGAARADITPDRPLPNYNGLLTHRTPRTLPLRSSVIVCRDSRASYAIASIDATFLDTPLVESIRRRIAGVTRIESRHILIAATHSHATPTTCPSFLSGALPNEDYLRLIVDRTVVAAQEAEARLQGVRIASGSIPNPLGWCRRWVDPAGQAHFMPEVEMVADWKPESTAKLTTRFLLFENVDGQPIAAIINVPCHNNFVFETYHADFYGWAAELLRERLHPDFITAPLPAPSGDIACRRPDELGLPGDAIQLAEEAGRMLGSRLLEAMQTAPRQVCDRITSHRVHTEIPDRSYEDSDFCHDHCRGDSDEVEQRIRGRYDPEETAVKSRGQTSCPVELQCLAFGNTAIVTNPAELFSEYDEPIQAASPFDVTLVSELTNGYCGYVPTVEAFEHGCYETHRTVHTSRLVKNAGERLLEMSVRLLTEAFQTGTGR
jgi:neutral ceramidase